MFTCLDDGFYKMLFQYLFGALPKVGDRYDWTEMNGGSTVSHLVRTPRVPFFILILIALEAKGLLAFQGRLGIASVVRWDLLRPVIFGLRTSRELQESLGPSRPEIPKSLEKVSRGLRARNPKKSGNSLEKVPNRHFRDFFQTFRTFSRLFSRLFWDFGPGGPERLL